MLKNRANLLERNTRKPLDELRDQRAVLEVLEQGSNGYASSAEDPRSAHAFGIPFDGGTRGPMNHAVNGTTLLIRRLNDEAEGRAGTRLAKLDDAVRRVPSSACLAGCSQSTTVGLMYAEAVDYDTTRNECLTKTNNLCRGNRIARSCPRDDNPQPYRWPRLLDLSRDDCALVYHVEVF